MAAMRMVSADSHMLEPADLWVERLDKRFRDRAPHAVPNEGHHGLSFVAPGINPFPIGTVSAIGKSGEELMKHLDKGYEAARPSGWDPVERLKDQEVDGVEAEVLYTSLGMPLFGLPDAELQRACFKVYNDWLAQFSSHNPNRLIGIALISLEDVAEGVRELERCRKLGLRGMMTWGTAPSEHPYSDPIYDPFWNAAAELEMPLSLHTITSKAGSPGGVASGVAMRSQAGSTAVAYLSNYMFLGTDIQVSLFSLVMGGVLERFPKLRIIAAESDTGWMPHFMFRLDHGYEKFGGMPMKRLAMKPSDYLRRQMFATFQDDPIGAALYKFLGPDNYMWASDFPHSDSTWPHSREVVERDFAGVPEEVTRKIVFDNAVRLYGINV
jgi:predicted TIM-barrel fold metal-dependent hydrolase